jgi:Protein of unknown function (DUF3122)
MRANHLRHETLMRILQLFCIGLIVLGVLLWATPTSESAIAAVVQLENTPQQAVYCSQQRLSDRTGQTWQVIFSKQAQHHSPELAASVSLRLAGLPGAANVNHPLPLIITTRSGRTLSAADVFLDEAPAPTIAQYDMSEVIGNLSSEPLQLTIPAIDQNSIDLDVPLTVVQEWQDVIDR